MQDLHRKKIIIETLSKKILTGLIQQTAQNAHAIRDKPVSAGSSLSRRTDQVLGENGKHQLRRENTYPGTGKSLKENSFVHFQSQSNTPSITKVSKDPSIRVFRLRCKVESFPLLQRNSQFAKDIQSRCQHIFDNGEGSHVPKSPRLLDQQELSLYIATDSDVDDISQKMSAIMGDHAYSEKKDVTEKCFKRDWKSVTLDQDCSCLILFLDKAETDITVLESSKVMFFPSPSIDVKITGKSQSVRVFREETESLTCIRRKLTHILGEDLFIYGEEVQKCLGEYEKTIKSPNPDQITMLRNTKEAVTVLLTRRVLPDRETSAAGGSTKCEIPDDIDSALNAMKDSGVMAFGLFVNHFVVFLDETCSDRVQKDTTRKIMKLCHERSNFKVPVDVVAVSQNFLTDTSLEQGHKVKSLTQWGSIGMVTEATKPITTETTKEADGPTTSNSEQETHKNIVVAITAGHLFTQNDDAFFVKNGESKKFGKCLTSLHRSGDTETMQYDIAVIEIDENMTTSEDCNLTFRNETGESCDCVVFNGTLDSGTVMYKKGAATEMSEGVVASPDFRLVGLIDTQKGYLIKGRDDRVFSEDGDSGSIVFTLDTKDAENRTVNLVSIATKMMSKDAARKLEIPVTLSYTVRLDRCLKKLSELKGVTVQMPEK